MLIVGFKGVDSAEYAELATPPMFFVISVTDKNKPTVVIQQPKLAGNIFDITHSYEKIIIKTTELTFSTSTYIIGVYNVGKEDSGKTNVEIFYEQNKVLGNDGSSILSSIQFGRLPFDIEILVGNKIIKAEPRFQYSSDEKNGGFKFTFNTTKEPDKIFLIRGDKKVGFDGKTGAVLN